MSLGATEVKFDRIKAWATWSLHWKKDRGIVKMDSIISQDFGFLTWFVFSVEDTARMGMLSQIQRSKSASSPCMPYQTVFLACLSTQSVTQKQTNDTIPREPCFTYTSGTHQVCIRYHEQVLSRDSHAKPLMRTIDVPSCRVLCHIHVIENAALCQVTRSRGYAYLNITLAKILGVLAIVLSIHYKSWK